MPLTLVRQDITAMQVDAIVNAANPALTMGGGVCGAIFRAAGEKEMKAACDSAAPIQTGGAAITPGFRLPCRYVIHAAGPVYHRRNAEQCELLLKSAYTESLGLALQHKCESIAFPLISAGIFGYPKPEALRVATSAIKTFLEAADMDVYLVVFEREALNASRKLMGRIDSYIDDHYVETYVARRRQLLDMEQSVRPNAYAPSFGLRQPSAAPTAAPAELDELVGNLDEPFSTTLLRLIDAKGMTDTEVYKRANLDRKLFSKIRTGRGYQPSKRTAIALAIGLRLTLPETDDLLKRLGYTLSHSQKLDVIIEYFILNGEYDIFRINEVLFQYDLPLLGGV